MTSFEFESSLDAATATLHPLALRLTRDDDDAKDLLQVTLLKAWSNKHRFNPGTNLKAWLYTIMKNTFLTDYQRKCREQTFVDITSNNFFINSNRIEGNGGEADANINIDEINLAIDKLPEVYRTPFRSFLEGFKYEEISKSLGLPLGTVKNRIFLARKELKQRLGYYQDPIYPLN